MPIESSLSLAHSFSPYFFLFLKARTTKAKSQLPTFREILIYLPYVGQSVCVSVEASLSYQLIRHFIFSVRLALSHNRFLLLHIPS